MLSTYKILVALFLPLSSSSEIGSGIQILEKNNVTLLNAEDIGSGNFEEFNSVKNVGFQEDLENSLNYFSFACSLEKSWSSYNLEESEKLN